MGSAIRRSIPVRTFADWLDRLPGFFEIDMVEHCGGPKTDGEYVHALTLTDIAAGWTECVAMRVREQMLVCEAFDKVGVELPLPMLGVASDNDSLEPLRDVRLHLPDWPESLKTGGRSMVRGDTIADHGGDGRGGGLADTAQSHQPLGRVVLAASYGQNGYGLPLPNELMRFAAASWHRGASHRNTALLVRDGEVPFIPCAC